MRDFYLCSICIFLGVLIGIIIFAPVLNMREYRKTKVVIKGEKVNFESNYNEDGDTYEIIVEKDTVKGIYFDNKWN